MLLCLSNIGDIMATSFRFLYWRVCCYFCTKRPKKLKRGRSTYRGSERLTRSRTVSARRSVRASARSGDSGIYSDVLQHSYHSDTELRYYEDPSRRSTSVPRVRPNKYNRTTGYATPRNLSQNPNQLRVNSLAQPRVPNSLDRRNRDVAIEMDPIVLDNTPILCNKYVIGKGEGFARTIPGKGKRSPDFLLFDVLFCVLSFGASKSKRACYRYSTRSGRLNQQVSVCLIRPNFYE
ncbi:unnamed protein product [Acanthoscelides obtectus]|nr:unnamed protein product [Acanthoscelides obtectus]CAK1649062.1 hypothetical protein AOBTE_LOCUS16014 [Acanthoscelides obtectus]